MNIFNKYKEILFSFFVLISTQIMVPIKIMGSVKYLYLFEFIMLIICAYLFFKLVIKKQKIKFDILKLIILVLFIIWFVIASIYKFYHFGNLNGNFIIIRVLLWPILLYFFFNNANIDKKNIILGMILFLLTINLLQIHNIFFVTNSFRGATILHNINIYIVICISCLPILFKMLSQNENSNKLKNFIIILIILISHLIISLSGTRIGFFLFPLILVLSYINNFGIRLNLRKILGITAYILSFILIITTSCYCNIFDSKGNVQRAISPIIEVIVDKNDTNDTPINETENKNEEVAENETQTIEKENNTQTKENELTQDSDNMRTNLWKKSIEFIKDSPIFGKNSVDIELNINLIGFANPVKIIQAPHNFILELWLAFGFPGMILYLTFLGVQIIKTLIKGNLKNSINLIIMLFAIFGCSFFQPLVTCYFVVSIILWMNLKIYEEYRSE